jgi:hypothetical protein
MGWVHIHNDIICEPQTMAAQFSQPRMSGLGKKTCVTELHCARLLTLLQTHAQLYNTADDELLSR